MSCATRRRFRNTLAFRLTLWYAAVFSILTALAFVFVYLVVGAVLRDQTDRELLSDYERFSGMIATQGLEAAERLALVESQAGGVKKTFFRFLYANGAVFASSNLAHWRDIPVDVLAIRRLLEDRRPALETAEIPGRPEPARVLYGIIGPGVILQVGRSLEVQSRFQSVFRQWTAAILLGMLLFSTISGWFMARQALAGVEAVTQTARRISRDALAERVPVENRGDEIEDLARTFNAMLDRIQALVTGMKEMNDNIAHDLRSPLTRIRGIAEVALSTGGPVREFEGAIASIIEESDRLLQMINTMLVLSEVEAGFGHRPREVVDLASMARHACELFQPLAEDRGVCLACDAPEACPFAGHPPHLERMLANLLDNAIKYTPFGGSVTVSCRTGEDGAAVLAVRDTGVGIAEEDKPHIFDRFYRSDPSRSREGVGLGLSLCRAVARAHGGDIAVESSPGRGSAFIVRLPRRIAPTRRHHNV